MSPRTETCYVRDIIYAAVLYLLAACTQKVDDPVTILNGHTMGITWKVTIRHLPQGHTQQELQTLITAEFDHIDAEVSHWRPASSVSRFNRTFTTTPFPVETDLQRILGESQIIHQKSSGVFDITIAPLVNLWGFGPVESTRGNTPSAEEIEKAHGISGMGKLKLLSDGTIRKTHPGLQVDLSALAKGYAIDKAAKSLDAHGVQHYLIELGGELRAKGNGFKGEGWQVGLEHPQATTYDPHIHRTISLNNGAVATSGTYRLAFIDPADGRTYSHIIDPRTGRPVDHGLIAVSVLASTAMEADAWATALMVLGSEEGLRLAEDENLVALFVQRTPSGVNVKTTASFPQ